MFFCYTEAMAVNLRLEGGPFDGWSTDLDDAPGSPPAILYVFNCKSCGEVHVDTDAPGDRYRFTRNDDRGWLYRFGDPNRKGGGLEELVRDVQEIEVPELTPV